MKEKKTSKQKTYPADEISENTLLYECGMGGTNVFRIVRVGNELLFLDAGPFFQGLSSAQSATEGGARGAAEGGIAGGMIAASLAGAAAALDEIKQAKAEKRREKLDMMTPAKLRAESETGTINFRADAGDLSDVRFDKLSFFRDTASPAKNCAGVLRFTHRTAGKKKYYLIKMGELKFAVYLLVDILGKDAVTVNLSVRKTRKK